jgi:Sulfotransferase domain
MPLMTPKIFGIGFHKTGTTSLADALTVLGYRVTGPNGVRLAGMSQELAWRVASDLLEDYDAFQDNPWPILYRELDRAVPGSKFVLTVRPDDAWLDSVVRHFGTESTPMREWIYGVGAPVGHEQVFLDRYRRHNQEVVEYFEDRTDDLLVMRVTEGDGWGALCPFLSREEPDEAFPHSNPAERRGSPTSAIARVRRRISR